MDRYELLKFAHVGGAIGDAVEKRGQESPAVRSRISRIFTISRTDLVILFAIVFLMVTKPGV